MDVCCVGVLSSYVFATACVVGPELDGISFQRQGATFIICLSLCVRPACVFRNLVLDTCKKLSFNCLNDHLHFQFF